MHDSTFSLMSFHYNVLENYGIFFVSIKNLCLLISYSFNITLLREVDTEMHDLV